MLNSNWWLLKLFYCRSKSCSSAAVLKSTVYGYFLEQLSKGNFIPVVLYHKNCVYKMSSQFWYKYRDTFLTDSKLSHNLQLLIIQCCVSLLYLCCYPSLNLVVTMDITVFPYSSIYHLELYHKYYKLPHVHCST